MKNGLLQNKGEPAWCYYDNNANNGGKYGKLYNWYAVNDKRGLAPTGWRIPIDKDWKILSDFLGGPAMASKKLKDENGWEKEGNGSNEVGFTALPGGFRKSTGEFSSMGCFALFWSSSEFDNKIASYRYLDCSTDELSSYNYLKSDGLSVRLIKE